MGKDINGKELGVGISQRKDGRYEARARINGNKIDIYDMSLTNLRKAFDAAKASSMQNRDERRQRVRISEWYDEWFKKCKAPILKSDACRKTYDRKLRNTFVRIIGEKRLDSVSQIDIQEVVNQLSDEGYGKRGIREAVNILRDCLESAVANRIIVSNPCSNIVINNTESLRERRVLEHWEQELFLRETEDSYYREAYRILLLTGMRIGEFSGLQWGDVDFDKKVIYVKRSLTTAYQDGKKIMELTTPKTNNSYRAIPFFAETESILLEWKKKQDKYKKKLGTRWRAGDSYGDLVFTTTMGSPVTRYNIVHDLKKVETNIILKEETDAMMEGRNSRRFGHLHPHCFRHTFATRCFEKNMNPVVVQRIMGHANYSTTLSYTHVLEDKTKEEVEKVGAFLESA